MLEIAKIIMSFSVIAIPLGNKNEHYNQLSEAARCGVY